MATGITTPSAMDFTNSSLDESWTFYKQKFDLYIKATDLSKKATETRCSILLSCIGDEALKVYNQFEWNEEENKLDLDTVVKKFELAFKPEKNVTYERHIFCLRNQGQSENIDSYVKVLRQLASTCEFENLRDSLIRDKLILGILDTHVKKDLLKIKKLTLENAISVCKLAERTKIQMESLTNDASFMSLNKARKAVIFLDKNTKCARKVCKNTEIIVMIVANRVHITTKSDKKKDNLYAETVEINMV